MYFNLSAVSKTQSIKIYNNKQHPLPLNIVESADMLKNKKQMSFYSGLSVRSM
jgi:hypothetical protein